VGVGWTPERTESLKEMWKGGLSAGQIANRLGGVTRNGVIGKVHRLGLLGKSRDVVAATPRTVPAPAPQPSRPSIVARKSIKRVVQPPQEIVVAAPPPAPSVPCDDRMGAVAAVLAMPNLGRCRFPFGDPAKEDFRFCFEPTVGTATYCRACAQLTYAPTMKRSAA
jgi:GcrA cell cycle regulator